MYTPVPKIEAIVLIDVRVLFSLVRRYYYLRPTRSLSPMASGHYFQAREYTVVVGVLKSPQRPSSLNEAVIVTIRYRGWNSHHNVTKMNGFY